MERVDDLLAARAVLEGDAELPLSPVIEDLEALDIAFILEHLGDALVDLGVEAHDVLRLVCNRVADAGEHVGGWVVH